MGQRGLTKRLRTWQKFDASLSIVKTLSIDIVLDSGALQTGRKIPKFRKNSPKDGGSMFPRNDGIYRRVYTASEPRMLSSSQSENHKSRNYQLFTQTEHNNGPKYSNDNPFRPTQYLNLWPALSRY
jgi:hypothetical protein